MRGAVAIVLLMCVGACAQVTPAGYASTVRSHGPSPTASLASAAPPYAVVVRIGGPVEPYVVQLVAKEGVGGPYVTAQPRPLKNYYFPPTPCPSGAVCGHSEIAPANLPEVSVSRSHVYVLDGDTQVRSLAIDGTVQDVMNIDAPPNSQVVFAVSPDDTRVAVAAITLATTNMDASFAEVMYVEDLGTAANRVDLYTSTTEAEWPVAWHLGNVVVGVGPWGITSLDTAYGAVGYRVVDAATGRNMATLDCATGLLSPAGTACVSGFCPRGAGCGAGFIGRQGYDGIKTLFALPPGPAPKIISALAQTEELSPDGTAVAVTALPSERGRLQNDTLLALDGRWSVLTGAGAPIGWIDDTHLVVAAAYDAYIVDTASPSQVLALRADKMRETGFPTLAGVLPTNLV